MRSFSGKEAAHRVGYLQHHSCYLERKLAMNFINLTPHALNIIEEDGTTVYTLPASGQVARVETTRTVEFVMDGIEVFETVYGEVTGLPERQRDTAYIVSALVAQAAKRSDVYSPGELVRNGAGQVIGCRGLTYHVGA